MAIAFDAASSMVTGSSSDTLAHTVGSGSDRVLFFGGGGHGSSSALTPTATYNSVSMTLLWYEGNAGSAGTNSWAFYLVNPSTGTHDIAVSGLDGLTTMGGISLDGVDQVTPIGTYATNHGSSLASTVGLSSATGELCLGVIHSVESNVLSDSPQVDRWTQNHVVALTGAGSTKDGAGSVTMAWTASSRASTQEWSAGAVPFKPVSAASNVPLNILIPSQVGFSPGR